MFRSTLKKYSASLNRKRLTKFYNDRAREYPSGYVLTKENEKEALSFYKRLTNRDISLASHNYYTEKTGAFHKEFIPDDLYYMYIDRYFNDATQSKSFSNKCYYDHLFLGMNMPETIVKRINGFWYLKGFQIITTEDVRYILAQHDEFFVKIASSSFGGKGVYYLSKDNGNIVKQFWELLSRINVDIVVQKRFKQHENLARANESSVNTLRILSLQRLDGSVKICSAILRMGISGSRVDNSSSGGLTCGIKQNGHCKDTGCFSYYAKKNAADKMYVHPTSGVAFNSIEVPNYDKVLDFVRTAQLRLPHFRMVSWDMSVDENGEPTLIEANLLQGGLEFHQVNNGPLFGDETEAILKEVFSE